jgi:signal transduction histidine kinase
VINTGYGSYESARDAVNLGAFAYVEKAGDPAEIVRHVHRAFHARLRRYAEDLESAVAERTREWQEANEALRLEIAERKRAEERVQAYQQRLRSLGAKLVVAEEQERRRIAAGLHDNVVQALVLAKMKLEGLAARKSAAQISQAILEIRGFVDQSVHDTRSLLFDLSPVALYELGFEPAVESLLDRIQAAHGLALSFRTDDLPKPMTNDVRVVLFRAVREVLQNVVKHAQARSGSVSVRRDGETVLAEVRDDGVGFESEKVLSAEEAGGGFGLFDVRERLDYLGGSLTIRSEPGKGTTVVLRVPLVPEKACRGGGMSHGDSSASG